MANRILLAACVFALSACKLSLERALEAGDVRGTVLFEAADGSRVAATGAEVSVVGVPGRVKADTRGRFVFRGLPAARHTLRISYDAGADGSIDGALRFPVELAPFGDGRAAGVDLGDVVVAAFGAISGRVTQGGPVEGARVVLVTTGETLTVAGNFSFDRVPAGTYDVAVAVGEGAALRVVAPRTVEVRARETATLDFDLAASTLETTGQASGLAFLGGQRTHDGTRIRLVSTDGSLDAAETSADGLWAGPRVPAGIYTLVAEANEYAPFAVPFVVVAGEIEAPSLTLASVAAPCGLEGNPLDATDPDGDGFTDEPEGCGCDPDGHLDSDDDGLCDSVDPDASVVAPVELRLEQFQPDDEAAGVSLSAPLVLTFDADVDADSVTASTILVRRGALDVPGAFVVDGPVVSFLPDPFWPASATIDVTVTVDVRGTDGGRPAASTSFSFGTAGDVLRVVGSFATGCVLRAPGTLWCWGDGESGQHGNGLLNLSPKPLQVGFEDDWTDVATGESHTCGIRAGQLWCSGMNYYGAAGFPRGVTAESMTRVDEATDWKDVAAGLAHSCAVKTDGSLWCWGRDNMGQAGDGPTDQTDQYGPALVHTGPFASVFAGADTNCAIHDVGSLWCWGRNTAREAGVTLDSSVPVPTEVVGRTDWTSLALDRGISCGLAGGTLHCWGTGAYAMEGLFDVAPATPRQYGTSTGYTAVSVGEDHACVVRDGALECWGSNWAGQLGDGTFEDHALPAAVTGGGTFAGAALFYDATCALDTAGALHCFGSGGSGERANGHNKFTPFPLDTRTGSDWVDVALGTDHSCGVKSDGSLWCTGLADGGGNGTDPPSDLSFWTRIGDGSDWLRVFSDGLATCGLRGTPGAASGVLWCFGGALGPLAVRGSGTDWTFASVADDHVCGLRQGGTVWCFGQNPNGVLFDGVAGPKAEPTDVSGGFTWVDVGTSQNATCAVRSTGEIYCTGWNTVGPGAATTPTLVAGRSDWAKVAVGSLFECALTRDGEAFCWGANGTGEFGNGTTGSSTLVPQPVRTRERFVDVVSAQGTYARTADGRWHAWGLARNLGVGQYSYLYGATPALVDGLTHVDQGFGNGCGLRDGALWCWGFDDNGLWGLGPGEDPFPRLVRFDDAPQQDPWESDGVATPQRAFRFDSAQVARADGRLTGADVDFRAIEFDADGGFASVWLGVIQGAGPVEVAVVGADGTTGIATATASPGQPARHVVASPDGSRRYLRVSGTSTAWTADALVLASDGCTADVAEPNDAFAAATQLPAPPAAPSLLGRTDAVTLCGADEDWFVMGVKAAVPALVRVSHFLPAEAVDVAFFEANGSDPASGVVAKAPLPTRGHTSFEYTVTSATDRNLVVRLRLASGSALGWAPVSLYTLR